MAAPGPASLLANRPLVDRATAVLAAIAVGGGIACYLKGGWALVGAVLAQDARLLVEIGPVIAAGLVIAGFVQVLLPADAVERRLGGAGWRGLLIGTAAGAVTPGGPFVSFPLVYALHRAGADIGITIAYVTAWSLLGMHRFLVFDLPLLGPEFSLTRLAVSLPMPILAGWVARAAVHRIGLPARGGPP